MAQTTELQIGKTEPPDLEAALRRSPRARTFFETLKAQNRYAILFRIASATKPETRAERIRKFVAMLEREESIYPQS